MKDIFKTGNKSKSGRKTKLDPAVYRYSIRLNSQENIRFNAMFVKSGMSSLTKFIKAAIFQKGVRIVRIDKATMDYYIRLTSFYTQFQAIGNNYNQTVKAIQSNFGDKRAASMLRNLEMETIKLVLIGKKIMQLTQEYEMKYLSNPKEERINVDK